MASLWRYGNFFPLRYTFLVFFFINYCHNDAVKKEQIHVTLPAPLTAALKALAKLEGRSTSDILEELARNALREHGVLPKPTAKEISEEALMLKGSHGNFFLNTASIRSPTVCALLAD